MSGMDDTQVFLLKDAQLRAAQQFRTGYHRAPDATRDGRRDLWAASIAGLLVLALLLSASMLFNRLMTAPDYGSGLPTGAGGGEPAAQNTYDWNAWRPTFPRVSDRVIEVRNRIPAGQRGRWNIKAAERWLDDATLSEMKVVSRCSGKAYRCITVRAGRVSGASVGWAERGVITIDTGKAARRAEYRSASVRKWLLVHELAHTFGLKHAAGRHVMNPTPGPGRLVLTKAQRTYLAAR